MTTQKMLKLSLSKKPQGLICHKQYGACKLNISAAQKSKANLPQYKSLKLPISNVPEQGDYTLDILVGSQKTKMAVILDTGSSTLGVKTKGVLNPKNETITPPFYDPTKDTKFRVTSWYENIGYLGGGWQGPVALSMINIGGLNVKNSYVSTAISVGSGTMATWGGILGLTHQWENSAYVTPSKIAYPKTKKQKQALVKKMKKFINNNPGNDNQIFFSTFWQQLEEQHGVIANKFAFYTLRSVPDIGIKPLTSNPVNKGWFVAGGAEEHTGLYDATKKMQVVKVTHPVYYNVNLLKVMVGETIVGANNSFYKTKKNKHTPDISNKPSTGNNSNAIVDSGTNWLGLATPIFNAWVRELKTLPKLKPFFALVKKNGWDLQSSYFPQKHINLDHWPPLILVLEAPNKKQITLQVPAKCYWQFNVSKDKTGYYAQLYCNAISGGQSILGITLMNNYYTIFDRNAGVVKFAELKPAESNPNK